MHIKRLFILVASMCLFVGSPAFGGIVLDQGPGGAAILRNSSDEPLVVLAYSIAKVESGVDLAPATWESLASQGENFAEIFASTGAIAETTTSTGTLLAPGETRDIGAPFDLQSDATGDGVANHNDLLVVSSFFGASALGPTFGDFNYDGAVNQADLDILAMEFNTATQFQFSVVSTSPTAVPEPSAFLFLGLVMVGRFGFVRLRRRKTKVD